LVEAFAIGRLSFGFSTFFGGGGGSFFLTGGTSTLGRGAGASAAGKPTRRMGRKSWRREWLLCRITEPVRITQM
jgi:hypothetical protein